MLIERVIATYFETNCWILAPKEGSECFIVDPGIGSPDLSTAIIEEVKRRSLKPVAVLLTHGHLDHTLSVIPIADGYEIPALIHSKDRGALLNPYQVIMRGGPTEQILNSLRVSKFSEPKVVQEVSDGESLDLGVFKIKVCHAPGHTAGSTMFIVDDTYLISGDVLFKGAIGRTDMPSGSMSDMRKSLNEKVLTLPDELIVLPGHGEQTTIGRERKSNPYLQNDFLQGK